MNRGELVTYLTSYASQGIYVTRRGRFLFFFYELRSQIPSRVCITRCDCPITYEFALLNKRYETKVAKSSVAVLVN
jgi:hypothetical protein